MNPLETAADIRHTKSTIGSELSGIQLVSYNR